ncbi:MAG: DUF3794 domain-containing protein [Tissierellaceae bacterium]|nr:DUF3794 domain-containing protein [Tissierellaceae bacterium]
MSIEILKDIVKVEEIKGTIDAQPLVETEVYLNTNKQEIESILWVEGRTDIVNTKALKDRLLVNGKVKFNIVYKSIDEEDKINTLETVTDFKEEIEIEGITEDMETLVKSNIEYIEYDLSDNRIDLQAVVNISATVEETKQIEFIHEMKGRDDFQILEESIRYKEVLGRDISYANIKETIKVRDNKPAIEKVIRFSIEAKELQTLVTEDRMILSAEAKVSMIYLGNNQLSFINESIPFNHFIEIPGIYKNSLGEVKLEVAEGIYEIVEDESGELRIIDLEINILVNGKVYDYKVRPIVVDVYSTKSKLNTEKEDIFVLENVEHLIHEEELNVDIGIDAMEVLDIKEDYNILDTRIINDEIVVEGLLTVDIFYVEGVSGELRNFKDNFPCKSNIYFDGDNEDISLEVNPRLGDLHYDIKKDLLSIDNDIKYDINVNKEKKINGIKNIEETEEMIDLKDRASITIYIVQKGDILWDIAKRYNTTIDEILSSNNLESSYEINVGDKIIIEKSVDNDFENI